MHAWWYDIDEWSYLLYVSLCVCVRVIKNWIKIDRRKKEQCILCCCYVNVVTQLTVELQLVLQCYMLQLTNIHTYCKVHTIHDIDTYILYYRGLAVGYVRYSTYSQMRLAKSGCEFPERITMGAFWAWSISW